MNNPQAVDLYRSMVRIRRTEDKIADLYDEQEMRCPTHLSVGQEAIASGVCEALGEGDTAIGGHRSHSHYLAMGGDLKAMMAELYGKETGCAEGFGGSMHLIDREAGFLGAAPIVSSTIPIGAGLGFGETLLAGDSVTVVFFGDAAVEEGVFHEAINFSLLKKLPVVFVCENNFFSVYTHLEDRQPDDREIHEMVEGHGIKTESGDGNKVDQVYEITADAVNYARSGDGPVFLEFETYRWREHCGPEYDNDLDYRSREEFEQWKQRCPLQYWEQRLLDEGILDESTVDEIRSETDRKIREAVEFAQNSPFPDPSKYDEYIYSDGNSSNGQ